jgi:hypothetical protein
MDESRSDAKNSVQPICLYRLLPSMRNIVEQFVTEQQRFGCGLTLCIVGCPKLSVWTLVLQTVPSRAQQNKESRRHLFTVDPLLRAKNRYGHGDVGSHGTRRVDETSCGGRRLGKGPPHHAAASLSAGSSMVDRM